MKQYLAKMLCFLFILTPGFLMAQDTGSEPVEEVAEFKTYMIEHPFEGCPGGSKCTKQTGQIRKAWFDTLKLKNMARTSAFQKKFGVPISMWSHPVKPVSTGLSLWDSPCPHHNQENKKIFLAEVMTSDFRKLVSQKNLIIGKAILRKSSGEFIQYSIPRGEAPIYIQKNRMVYALDLDGEYYSISIAADGTIEMVNSIKPERFPENIKCSDDMIKAFKSLNMPENLFKGTSCKSIWDVDAKAFKSIVYGWSCS